MKITVLQEEFSKALSIASRFTSPKVQLPVLANVLLSAEKSSLYISGTNLEISVSTTIGAEVSEEGKITIPARTLFDIIGNLSKGKVELESKGDTLTISSRGFTSTVTGMNAADFPVIPRSLGKNAFGLSSKELLSALNSILFSVSIDESRPLLTGVLWILENKKVTFVATDGFRLSRRFMSADISDNAKIIVPKGILLELARLKDPTEEEKVEVSYTKEENQLVCRIGNTIFSSRLIDGDFPPFERIIPKETNMSMSLGKSELLRAIKIASVFARDSANVVKCKLHKAEEGKENMSLEVFAESPAKGNQSTTIEAEVTGKTEGEFVIAFNCKFLEDFLSFTEGEEVVISCVDVNTAAIFKDPTNPDFLHIIMPIRLQS
jgi:DNA polymerase III subunit beta